MAIYIGSSKKTIRVGSSITRTLLIPELVSIVVTAPPTQTEYNPFTSFNPAGMVVTAEYDNGEKKVITDYTITNGGYLTADMTSVTISYTARGITKTTTQDIRVNHIKLDIPYSNDTFVYTGTEMTPVWTGYDTSVMTMSGTTSGMNAGTYIVTFTLNDKVNYRWSDGTTEDKAVNWVIEKAQASITLDKTSVVLNTDKLTDTVTFSSVGMASVMVMSSDMSVATVSMEGNVITISSVNETTGTANIVISGEVDSNYNAPEYPSIEVSAEFAKPVLLTVRCDDTRVTESIAYFTIDGVKYSGAVSGTYEITDKSVLTVYVADDITLASHYGTKTSQIYLNGTLVAEQNMSSWYTVPLDDVSNVNLAFSANVKTSSGETSRWGVCNITAVPEGYALVNITDESEFGNYAYVTIDGVKYTTATTLVVPIDTVIACTAIGYLDDLDRYYKGYIYLNGVKKHEELDGTYTYNHTLVGNVSIHLYNDKGNGSVYITEFYAINFNTVPNGTLTANATAGASSTVTLTPTPDEGYMYGGATVTYTLDGVEQTITLDASTTTFTMPAADVTVTPVWVALISFIMNGETYRAEPGMSWSAWFASSYNTTGETEGTITDANGNEVSMDAVIVGGTAYEVGFDDGMRTITIGKSSFLYYPTYGCIVVNGETFYGSTTEEQSMQVPIGTVIEARIIGAHTKNPSAVIVNGETVVTWGDSLGTGGSSYEYTVKGDTMVSIENMVLPAFEGGAMISVSKTTITITEIPEGPITFTIKEYSSGEKTYQAEGGMTWGEWVDSKYNPEHSGGIRMYKVKDNMIYNIDESLYVRGTSDYTFPSPTDLILPNFAYDLSKD